MGKTGIIIEGGAMRSIYAAGILDYFLEQKIEIPNVLAVSAGSLCRDELCIRSERKSTGSCN